MAELKKQLGLLDVFCIAAGAMISSGLFILPGLVFARAGPAVVLCYLFAGLLSLPGLLSIAEMTTAMPRAGSDCFTAIRSMGPAVGTVAGLLSWFSLATKAAFALVGISVFTSLIVDLNMHVTAIFLCLLFLTVNIIGVKHAGRTQVGLVLALFALMVLYLAFGLSAVRVQRFEPFAPHGFGEVLFGTGFVFISYAGLLTVASVAEEIRNPARDIPLGMGLALLIVVIFYCLMVFVTAGTLDADNLAASLTPISDSAEVFLGTSGRVLFAIAGILAFLSTANSGIMTAARSLVPLSKEGLLPRFLEKINPRFSTPLNSLLITGVVIVVSLLLRLEILVEAASIALILINIFACLSVIILRESRIQNYRPSFKSPLYPWTQIIGLAGFTFVIVGMKKEGLLVSSILVFAGAAIYFLYGRRKVKREYALLHVIERLTARELTTYSLEAELREIIRERDEIVKDRFDHIIENCPVLDIDRPLTAPEFFDLAAQALSPRVNVQPERLVKLLAEREAQSSTVLTPHLAIPHIVIDSENVFDILLARCKDGINFSWSAPSVHAVFVIAGSKDRRNFHLYCLSAIAQIVQGRDFEHKWTQARSQDALRDIILLGERKRYHEAGGF